MRTAGSRYFWMTADELKLLCIPMPMITTEPTLSRSLLTARWAKDATSTLYAFTYVSWNLAQLLQKFGLSATSRHVMAVWTWHMLSTNWLSLLQMSRMLGGVLNFKAPWSGSFVKIKSIAEKKCRTRESPINVTLLSRLESNSQAENCVKFVTRHPLPGIQCASSAEMNDL